MVKTKPDGYWNSWFNLKKELDEIIAKNNLGHIPTPSELKELDCNYLLCAVYIHHRKYRDFVKRIEDYRRYKDSLPKLSIESKKFEDIAELCIKLLEEEKLVELPSHKSMINLGYGNLAYIIKTKQGGFGKFRQKFAEYLDGQCQEGLQRFLEQYAGGSK